MQKAVKNQLSVSSWDFIVVSSWTKTIPYKLQIMENPNPNKKNNNKWLAFINIPIQMGAIIFLFSYFGTQLDLKYPNFNTVFVKMLTLVGVAIAFYNLNRQLKDINKTS